MALKTENGFILIAVLWISLLLSIFALNLSTKSRLKGVQVLNIESRLYNNEALHSGLSRGYHEYLKYRENRTLLDKREEWESLTGNTLDLWHPRYEPYMIEVGDVKVAVRIKNTQGRLNVNQVDVHLLQEVVSLCGASPGVETTSVTNSILDWIDQDDLTRPEGAEKDHYLSLQDPYLPKNSDIENMGELLLIKGITRDIFFGTEEHPGLVHFFSTQGSNEKMDINSAAPETFSVLGDLPQEVVQDIIDKRTGEKISDLSQLADIIPHGYMDQLLKYFQVGGTEQMIAIEAYIVLKDGRLGRSMERIVRSR